MKSRYLAGTSLAVMGAGFLITLILPQNLGVRLLQGGFEAGLVGGFADWFAVTALFRHPMGIPIPHTSLLLKNRDKIVNSLISALETELLNKESITKRLRKMKLFQGLSTGLMKLLSRKKNPDADCPHAQRGDPSNSARENNAVCPAVFGRVPAQAGFVPYA